MARARESALSPRRLVAAERQTQALELRKAGVTYDAIAKRLGYKTAQGAYAAIEAALKRTQQQPADSVRLLEIERLDKLMTALWPAALKGEYPAVDRVIKIMERRALLLGLDAPRKLDVTYQLRQMALADGLDPDEMVRAAEMILQTGG